MDNTEKDLVYFRKNAEEDYLHTPISVLRYISELESNIFSNMSFEFAAKFARNNIKIKHTYFTDKEYMTMQGNNIIFEDGTSIMSGDWMEGKDYLLTGWSLYEES